MSWIERLSRASRQKRTHVLWGYRMLLGREPESNAAIEQIAAAVATPLDVRRVIMASDEFRMREAVLWGYRMLLGREPENETMIEQRVAAATTPLEICRAIMASDEFRTRVDARREAVVWGYRMLLGREPENEGVIEQHAAAASTPLEIRRSIMASSEYRAHAEAAPPPPELDARVFARTPLDGRVLVDLRDHAIGLSIALGTFEPLETEWLLEHLRPGDHFVDVGANIGYFSVLAAKRVGALGRVSSFEPVPAVRAMLLESLAESRVTDLVHVLPNVVSDAPGRVQLKVQSLAEGSRNSGGSHLLPAQPSGSTRAGDTLEVEAVRLDDLALERVDLLKVDVEGAEPLVFRGARATLERHRPKILFEVNPLQLARVSGSDVRQVFAYLDSLGYEIRWITGQRAAAAEIDATTSAVAIPRGR